MLGAPTFVHSPSPDTLHLHCLTTVRHTRHTHAGDMQTQQPCCFLHSNPTWWFDLQIQHLSSQLFCSKKKRHLAKISSHGKAQTEEVLVRQVLVVLSHKPVLWGYNSLGTCDCYGETARFSVSKWLCCMATGSTNSIEAHAWVIYTESFSVHCDTTNVLRTTT